MKGRRAPPFPWGQEGGLYCTGVQLNAPTAPSCPQNPSRSIPAGGTSHPRNGASTLASFGNDRSCPAIPRGPLRRPQRTRRQGRRQLAVRRRGRAVQPMVCTTTATLRAHPKGVRGGLQGVCPSASPSRSTPCGRDATRGGKGGKSTCPPCPPGRRAEMLLKNLPLTGVDG